MHSNGFQEDEKIQARAVIFSNVVVACKVLMEIMGNQKIDFHDDATRLHAELLENLSLDVDAGEAFKDNAVKEASRKLSPGVTNLL